MIGNDNFVSESPCSVGQIFAMGITEKKYQKSRLFSFEGLSHASIQECTISIAYDFEEKFRSELSRRLVSH